MQELLLVLEVVYELVTENRHQSRSSRLMRLGFLIEANAASAEPAA